MPAARCASAWWSWIPVILPITFNVAICVLLVLFLELPHGFNDVQAWQVLTCEHGSALVLRLICVIMLHALLADARPSAEEGLADALFTTATHRQQEAVL